MKMFCEDGKGRAKKKKEREKEIYKLKTNQSQKCNGKWEKWT